MGQYYNAILINKENKTSNYAGNGSFKLTEHSWFENPFVNWVCKKLLNNPQNVAWVGDYAAKKDNEEKLHQFIDINNKTKTRYHECKDNFNTLGLTLVNRTKRVYIRMTDYYHLNVKNNEYYDDWVMHPLPLLTAVGNGNGGGDYHGINMDLVGSWAGDVIEVVDLSNLWNNNQNEYEHFMNENTNITRDILFKEEY